LTPAQKLLKLEIEDSLKENLKDRGSSAENNKSRLVDEELKNN